MAGASSGSSLISDRWRATSVAVTDPGSSADTRLRSCGLTARSRTRARFLPRVSTTKDRVFYVDGDATLRRRASNENRCQARIQRCLPNRCSAYKSRVSRGQCSNNATLGPVTDIPARELRNDVSGVLRRVEAGERLRVTVSGRPVAELVPLPRRPTTLPWEVFIEGSDEWRADSDLATDLALLVPDTTDDAPVP